MSWLVKEEPATPWIGAAAGVLAGTAAYLVLLPCAQLVFPIALVVSALLRIGILLRR